MTMAALALLCGMGGCKARSTADREAAPSASAIPMSSPVTPERVQEVVNPSLRRPYSGPTGSVRGLVRASGDPAPSDVARLAEIPQKGDCAVARGTYEKAFREGPNRELADVLVAVTGYDAFIPSEGSGPTVTFRDCAFDTRTVGLMFGQSVAVRNKGGVACIPELVGEETKALLVAIPGGDPVMLHPMAVGHYALVDNSHPHVTADVFVLRFPTFAVTGNDGRFDVGRLPPGEVKVSAYLPATGQTVEKKVMIAAGQTVAVDLDLSYDATKHAVRGVSNAPAPSAPAPAPSASAQ
jgi:hypothetical protein